MAVLAPAYAPRRPTETALYALVRDHLETFRGWARETYEKPLPRYVEQELRAYLKCGVFAHGFVRCRCDACAHDLLVAFSCKGSGVCPSNSGWRMANTAAHLVDRVLPAAPVRQWVLSLPYELRMLAALDPDVLGALCRVFVDAVFATYRGRRPRHAAHRARRACGAITLVQRFGGGLNLNVHFHVVVVDGVFRRDGAGRVRSRGGSSSERRGASLRRRACRFRRTRGRPHPSCDAVGRERLRRCGARPALALDRLRRTRDGLVTYRVRHARAGRAKHRVMTPIECLAPRAGIARALTRATSRIDWATLLRRTFEIDVLECPRCHGRLRMLGAVTAPLVGGLDEPMRVIAPSVAEKWLERLLNVDWKTTQTGPHAEVQMARVTGDRARDVSDRVRAEVEKNLGTVSAKPEWIRAVRELVEVDEDERVAILGECLPIGLRLA